MVKKKCSKTSCREYIDYSEQYCDKHKGNTNKVYNRTIRYSADNRQFTEFYNSSKWRKLSKRKRLSNPCCEKCLEQGRIIPVDVVDHIIELKDDWEKRLDWSNLQSLCHACHNFKTAMEKNKRV